MNGTGIKAEQNISVKAIQLVRTANAYSPIMEEALLIGFSIAVILIIIGLMMAALNWFSGPSGIWDQF